LKLEKAAKFIKFIPLRFPAKTSSVDFFLSEQGHFSVIHQNECLERVSILSNPNV